MAQLPSGTVTFLFTDIEGSTRLLTRLRGGYAEVLGEHQRVLRAAFDEHDGREVHTEGDAFFVAFARASDAIAAAVAGQRALASQSWPEGGEVRVRMGVHTGEAAIAQDDYVGLDVHRAARICAAGHRARARWAAVHAMRPHASGRCERRSTGATSCSATQRRRASHGLPCSRARSACPPPMPIPRCARALCIKGMALWPLARGAEQLEVLDEAEALARESADPAILSRALTTRADREASADRLDVADALADEALHCANVAGDRWEIAEAARVKAMAAATIADLRERVDRAASLLGEVGNVYRLADLLASAAYVALCLASDHDAKDFVERAIPTTRALDSPYLWMLLRGNIGLAALLTGDIDSARDAFREELELCRKLVVRPFASEGLTGLAAVAVIDGDVDRAARLAGAAVEYR